MYRNDEGLGFAIPAGVSAVTSIAGGVFKDSKDPGRLSGNSQAYAAALAGDTEALKYLQGRSGRFGSVATTYTLGDKSPIGPWATQATKDDAYAKYQSALSKLSGVSSTPHIPSFGGGPVIAGLSTGPLLIAGVAALGIFALTRRR